MTQVCIASIIQKHHLSPAVMAAVLVIGHLLRHRPGLTGQGLGEDTATNQSETLPFGVWSEGLSPTRLELQGHTVSICWHFKVWESLD